MENLDKLVERSLFILREAKAQFKNPAVLWSTGKDSTTCLHLCKKAFFGKIPFPAIFIQTGHHSPEIYEFRDKIAKEWNLNLLIAKNKEAINSGISPESGRLKCCSLLKTEALKNLLEKEEFDALIVSIRRDEHGIRAKERVFSPRDKEFRWEYKKQPPEMWDLFTKNLQEGEGHIRVHILLDWMELDVWRYIKREGLPVNSLYFAQKKDGKWSRFRSLGCEPCTIPIPSRAKNIDEIIQELKTTEISERSGRSQDKEKAYAMQRLRALGYL